MQKTILNKKLDFLNIIKDIQSKTPSVVMT